MPLVVRPKNAISRIVVSADGATAFRRICQHVGKAPDKVLEEMMRLYVRTAAPELEVIEIDAGAKG
jgi:hypothetical protein